jgi:hypothetical protein
LKKTCKEENGHSITSWNCLHRMMMLPLFIYDLSYITENYHSRQGWCIQYCLYRKISYCFTFILIYWTICIIGCPLPIVLGPIVFVHNFCSKLSIRILFLLLGVCFGCKSYTLICSSHLWCNSGKCQEFTCSYDAKTLTGKTLCGKPVKIKS